VVADSAGKGRLTLHFEKVREASDFLIGFTVTGADVVGGTVIPAAAGDDIRRGIVTSAEKNIAVELQLANLIPQASISVRAFDLGKKDGKPGKVEVSQTRRVIQMAGQAKAN